MDNQTTIHDYPLKEPPQIFSNLEIDKILYAIRNPFKSRSGEVSYWLKERNATIFLMQYHLALRTKEVLCIKKSDVDMKAGLIRINPNSNKLRKGRILPMNRELMAQLRKYLIVSKMQYWNFSDYLFPSLKSNRLNEDQWQEIFKNALIQIGLYQCNKTRPYTLRHTKATNIYDKTKDPIKVATILGHKTLESTKTYIHLSHLKSGLFDVLRDALS